MQCRELAPHARAKLARAFDVHQYALREHESGHRHRWLRRGPPDASKPKLQMTKRRSTSLREPRRTRSRTANGLGLESCNIMFLRPKVLPSMLTDAPPRRTNRTMAWPKTVFRGLEVLPRGEKNRRYAVGPSDGKTNGLWLTSANKASTPIVTKPLTNT